MRTKFLKLSQSNHLSLAPVRLLLLGYFSIALER